MQYCLFQLSVSDRVNLLDDAFALAQAQIVPYVLALDLSLFLRGEEAYAVWQRATSIFNDLNDKLSNNAAQIDLKVSRLFKKLK